MEKLHNDLLQGRVTQLEERYDSLFKLTAECKATLQSGTAVLVYDCASDILNYDAKPHPPNIDIPQFTPGGDITKQMKEVLGFLDIPTDHQPLDIPTDHQPLDIPTDHQPLDIPTDQQPLDIPTDHQPLDIPTDHQPLDIPTDHQPLDIPTDQQPLDIPTDHQPLDIPTDHQPQSPTADQCPAVRPKLTRDRDQTSSQPSSADQRPAVRAKLTRDRENTSGQPSSADQRPAVRPKLTRGRENTSGQPCPYELRDRPRVITKFSWKDGITSIRPSTADGHAWLCHLRTTALLVNAKGETIQRIKHNSNIQDISVDPNTGHLWSCCSVTQTVHEASSSAVSPVVTRFTTDHDPYSLCVTREGRVVVGMVVDGRPYQVGVYTKEGVVLHTTTGEGTGTVVPISITQCPLTSNIAVVSVEVIRDDGSDVDDWRRHIVVYTDRLSLLYHYRGTDIKGRQVRTPGTFRPWSITYDSRGNIVMADDTSNTIELISGEGHHIKTLHSGKGQRHIGLQTVKVKDT